jgi:outer membrane lipoprotein SlyB
MLAAASLFSLTIGCATTTTSSRVVYDPNAPGYGPRTGTVESVQEVVQRVQGNPVGGALAGGLIGGLLFHGRGPATVVGAAGGAAVGAAASQGSAERRTYQVVVRFDDGAYGMFAYGGYSPFAPGEPVVLTPQGLARRW